MSSPQELESKVRHHWRAFVDNVHYEDCSPEMKRALYEAWWYAFMSALMPYLYPSSIHEMIEMGLLGIAMSRYSGCWVGMKVITETVETTAEIDLTDEMTPFVVPADFETNNPIDFVYRPGIPLIASTIIGGSTF